MRSVRAPNSGIDTALYLGAHGGHLRITLSHPHLIGGVQLGIRPLTKVDCCHFIS
jgi:hypothetical protein